MFAFPFFLLHKEELLHIQSFSSRTYLCFISNYLDETEMFVCSRKISDTITDLHSHSINTRIYHIMLYLMKSCQNTLKKTQCCCSTLYLLGSKFPFVLASYKTITTFQQHENARCYRQKGVCKKLMPLLQTFSLSFNFLCVIVC